MAAMPATATTGGWATLFGAAFRDSRNPMALLDEQRRHVAVNAAYVRLLGLPQDELLGRPMSDVVVGGPRFTPQEWARALARAERVAGEAELRRADGTTVAVQWGATIETVTGRRFVLVVALSTSRWGERFRRDVDDQSPVKTLSPRELEIVRLVARGATGPEIAD